MLISYLKNKSILDKTQIFLFLGYVFALTCSMSLMELFSIALIATQIYEFQKVRLTFWLDGKSTRSTRGASQSAARPSTLSHLAKISSAPFLIPMFYFVMIAIVGILLSEATTKQKLYDIGRMRFFLGYFSIFLFFQKFKDFENNYWIKTLFIGTLVIGCYAFFQHFFNLRWHHSNQAPIHALEDLKAGYLVHGTFGHHLSFSNIYLYFAALFLSLGIYLKDKKSFVLSCFLFLLILWTQSRMAFIAIPLCVLVIVAFKNLKAVGATAIILAIGLSGYYLLDPIFKERVNRAFVQDTENSLGPRFRLWRAQIEFFKESPLFGVGYNNNERRSKEMVDKLYPHSDGNFYGHAHSTPLQILATTGLLGFPAISGQRKEQPF
jgi:hypothetical protein